MGQTIKEIFINILSKISEKMASKKITNIEVFLLFFNPFFFKQKNIGKLLF